MKKILSPFYVYFLAAAILVSGNGLVLAIHTCFTTSAINVTLFKENSCCSKKNINCNSESRDRNNSVSSKCCSSEFSYQKLSSPFLLKKSFKFPSVNYLPEQICINEMVSVNEKVSYHFEPPGQTLNFPLLYHQLLI